MRRVVTTAALAWGAGFCMAAAAAWGYAELDAWRGYGESFQLGYVVGYLDAVTLAKRHDPRTYIPVQGKPKYERWRALVNDFYADPANARRSVPAAMAAAGKVIQDEFMKDYAARSAPQSPQPTPGSKAAPAAP